MVYNLCPASVLEVFEGDVLLVLYNTIFLPRFKETMEKNYYNSLLCLFKTRIKRLTNDPDVCVLPRSA